MKLSLNKANVLKLHDQFMTVLKTRVQCAKSIYQRLNRYQRWLLLSCVVVITVILIMLITVRHSVIPNTTVKANREFSSHSSIKLPSHKTISQLITPNMTVQWQARLHQFERDNQAHFAMLQHQLQTVQLALSSLASQQDVQQLQEHIGQPDIVLRHKVDHLQDDVQKVVQQTATARWVNPKTVERYFQLVAVQGFSDGMRAIIDVANNELALGVHERCPVCRGWVLEKLDFTHQKAVFKKTIHHQTLSVMLQAR